MSEGQRSLHDGWSHLATGTNVARDSKWTAFDTEVAALDRTILLARDEDDRLHLLVPTSDRNFSASRPGQTLTMDARAFSFGKMGSGDYLDISCSDPALNAHFRTVAEDVVERVQGSMAPAQISIGVVAEWRQLFASTRNTAISYQKRMSLFAELSALEEIGKHFGNIEPQWWTGPESAPHDIEHPEFSLEVKAIGVDSESVRINGIHQLDSNEGKPLFLYVLPVDEQDDGRSLRDLAAQVLERTHHKSQFRRLMMRAGVLAGDRSGDDIRLGAGIGFVLRVDETTPRIVASQLDEGVSPAVSGVRYDVELSALAVRGVSDDFESVLEEGEYE